MAKTKAMPLFFSRDPLGVDQYGAMLRTEGRMRTGHR
jgi:hypothetical protein